MVYRDLQNTQTTAGGFHLHLQIPAVSFLAHVEFRESLATDRSKGAHVSVTNSVKQAQNHSRNSSCQNLLQVHAALFALPPRARADHEITCPPRNWIDKL